MNVFNMPSLTGAMVSEAGKPANLAVVLDAVPASFESQVLLAYQGALDEPQMDTPSVDGESEAWNLADLAWLPSQSPDAALDKWQSLEKSSQLSQDSEVTAMPLVSASDSHMELALLDAGAFALARQGDAQLRLLSPSMHSASDAALSVPRLAEVGAGVAEVARAAMLRNEIPEVVAASVSNDAMDLPLPVDSFLPAAGRVASGDSSAPVAIAAATRATAKNDQPLMQALGDRIQLQRVKGIEVATVRLDPPQMGSLEIRIRQDGAGVQVHMQASQSEVGRQLSSVVDNLKQELQARWGEASVTVVAGRSLGSGTHSDSQARQSAFTEQEVDPVIGQALQVADIEET